jgi:hypothetical protein
MRWNEDVAINEKMCPMTLRVAEGKRFQGHKCLGSECMAWRGSKHVPVTVRINLTNVGAKEQPKEIVFLRREIEKTGYCGMAGPAE